MSGIPLDILPAPDPPATTTGGNLRAWLLRLYRLAVLILIVTLIHRHFTRLRIDGDLPITISEVLPFIPTAKKLQTDDTDRKGLFIFDATGKTAGYVLRTSPIADGVKGYAGPTDTLIIMNDEMRVIGIKVRKSWDTKSHLRDVVADDYFMKHWNGKTWDQIAGITPAQAKIEGVSGASLTSMAIANSIHQRFAAINQSTVPQHFSFHWHDAGLILIIAFAIVLTFTKLRSNIPVRRSFQFVLIAYLGLINGRILAQSLLGGWATGGIPWQIAPGLALLLAAALIMPWLTRRPLYCAQICPHGAAQELLGRITHRRIHLHRGLEKSLRMLPAALVLLALLIIMLRLPIDLADIEPFDAYLIKSAGIATLSIAIIGLIVSIFIPMAYCKFGCPTGWVLNFIRSHGKADRFQPRDIFAGALVLMVFAIERHYPTLKPWIEG